MARSTHSRAIRGLRQAPAGLRARRAYGWFLGGIAALVALGLAAPAGAMPPPAPPATLSPPLLVGEGARHTADHWVVDCGDFGHQAACRFEATFDFEVASAEPVAAIFGGHQMRGVELRVAGAAVAVEPAASAVVDPPAAWLKSGRRQRYDAAYYRFALPAADGVVRVEAAGEVTPVRDREGIGWLLIAAVHARHLLLHQGDYRSAYGIQLTAAGVDEAAAPDYRATAIISLHEGVVTMDGAEPDGRGSIRREVTADPGGHAVVDLEEAGDAVHFGGPILGLGSTTGDGAEFRLRLGVEAGALGWLLFGVTADTDFDDVGILTPQVEASTPTLLFLPLALSVGVGAPIRFGSETEAGVRFITGVHLLAIGFVATFDLYPGRDSDDLEVTLMARFTL